jgi:hypothetical protein
MVELARIQPLTDFINAKLSTSEHWDGELTLGDFIGYVKGLIQSHSCDLGLIGTTAWSRDLKYMNDIQFMQLCLRGTAQVLPLTPEMESDFELTTVKYAASRMGVDNIAVIGAGGGSVQFNTRNGPILLPIGYDARSKRILERSEPGMLWLEDVIDPTTHIPELMYSGKTVGITGCYYAAKLVGVESAEDEIKFYKVSEVWMKWSAYLATLYADVVTLGLKTVAAQRNSTPEEVAMRMANMCLQISLFRNMFDPNCLVCFKRAWLFPGAQEALLSSWGVGWFIQQLDL